MGLLISKRTYTVISRTYTQTVSAAPMAINNKKKYTKFVWSITM